MARIRTIKPSFFTSLTIADLTLEQRLTFIGLWTHCDDEGRCVYDPRLIRAALWPLSDRTIADVAGDVQVLTEASLMTHYKVGERAYLAVANWSEHQKVNRPTKSSLPGPESGVACPVTCGDSHSLRTHGVITEDSRGERKGREGNKEGKGELPSSPPAAATASETDPYLFAEFWKLYPRKVGKEAARKAWARAARKVNPDDIVLGAGRYARDPNLPPENFIPHPEKWLNDGRWADGPLPPRGARSTPGRPTTDDRVREGLDLANRLAQREATTRLEIAR
jgi:hypothetical protein